MIKLPDTGELRSVHAPVSRSTCRGRGQGLFYKYTETLMARTPMSSFTMAVLNSFLSPLEKIPWLQIWEHLG